MTVRAVAVAAAAALLLTACSHAAVPQHAAHGQAGPGPAVRIVSLAPSLTEIAYAIGCQRQLVGDTAFDDYPPAAKSLTHVADLSHVDLETLAKLRPTIVLALHDQEKEGTEIAERLDVPVRYLPNRGLDDLYADIDGVGAACRDERAAAALRGSMERRIDALASKAAAYPTKPRVLFLLGLPGFTAGKGSFLDDLIELAGGVDVASGVGQPYPDLSGESIVAMQPDVIVVAHDVPFGADVRSREPWRSLEAVRAGRIAVSPDDDIIERQGPRIVEGLAWLERAIHRR